MKRFAAVAVMPLFAGFLWAQADQTTTRETQTTTTTMQGTLVDASCRTTHSEHSSSSTTTPEGNTTTTESHRSTTDDAACPVTATTTEFGLMTPDGRYVPFAEPSNTKVVEIVKNNKKWNRYIMSREPLKVRVVGRPDGQQIVVESIE